jgi:protein-disulfide isomerase
MILRVSVRRAVRRYKGSWEMNRNRLSLIAFAAVLVLMSAMSAWGGDTSVLRPPKGSKVALLVFEDLQCPDCARAAPLLHEAARKYNIPLVQYDFPLPMHNWSFEAAVNARYFDTKSKKLGDDYRLFIFANQPQITPQNLRGMTERFAADNKVTVPFVVDPTGELTAKVNADKAIGQRVGLEHTPTIYVVSDTVRGTPFIEVVNRDQLYQLIDKVIKESGPSAPAPKSTASKSTAPKSASTKAQ